MPLIKLHQYNEIIVNENVNLPFIPALLVCICICHFASLSHIILQILSITQEDELVYYNDKKTCLTLNYNEIRLIFTYE